MIKMIIINDNSDYKWPISSTSQERLHSQLGAVKEKTTLLLPLFKAGHHHGDGGDDNHYGDGGDGDDGGDGVKGDLQILWAECATHICIFIKSGTFWEKSVHLPADLETTKIGFAVDLFLKIKRVLWPIFPLNYRKWCHWKYFDNTTIDNVDK